MQEICITESGVFSILSQLDPHKAGGPDNIPARVLKELAYDLTPILTHLFQQSLDTGELPQDWKSAFITPIFKKGKRSDPLNYRPISLTSIICKSLEHILVSQIMKHLETNNIICRNQFGFRSGHSCETQLLVAVNDFAYALNNKLQVDIGILDFSKAFDKVPHTRLAQKLEFYGIRGKPLEWIKSFLFNRSQRVVIEGSYSSPCKVTSGVPQGSVLGPTLFLVYINDLITGIQSTIRLFADDCIIYRPINSSTDHQILQQDLNTLTSWAATWQMQFNVNKCSILQLSKHHHKSLFPYSMMGKLLKIVEQHSYLGIQIDHRLSWRPQVDYVCSKATRLIGFLQRNLRNCPRELKELSFKQFVLPVLDYGASIWDPYHYNNINKIEMIQHRAARFVLDRPWRRDIRDSISSMLLSLGWPSLQLRRKCARLVLMFKLLHNILVIPPDYLPTLSPVTITRSSHDFKFFHYQPAIDCYKFSFFPRTVPEWNNLSLQILQEQTLDAFKKSLYQYYNI